MPPSIRFLVDENVPVDVITFLRERQHVVLPVGEYFAKSSPDVLLAAAAEIEGLVIVTFDRDFRRLVRQLPSGVRTQAAHHAGRISVTCTETELLGRRRTLIDVIEVHYAFSQRQGHRLIMQISATSYTFVE